MGVGIKVVPRDGESISRAWRRFRKLLGDQAGADLVRRGWWPGGLGQSRGERRRYKRFLNRTLWKSSPWNDRLFWEFQQETWPDGYEGD